VPKRVPKPQIAAGKIPNAKPPPPRHIVFSFKYLTTANPKFTLDRAGEGYFETFIKRLKHVCALTATECRISHSGVLRSHPIRFANTSEPSGFGFTAMPEQLKEGEPFQFALTSNEHGRVHGILVDNLFYLVWVDPDHLLYPGH
jgi:hypothetical protein